MRIPGRQWRGIHLGDYHSEAGRGSAAVGQVAAPTGACSASGSIFGMEMLLYRAACDLVASRAASTVAYWETSDDPYPRLYRMVLALNLPPH